MNAHCAYHRQHRNIAALPQLEREHIMERLALLKQMSFGSQVAEQEVNALADYFVETDLWNRIINGEIDIIRGEKGTGKSAIYLLLEDRIDELFDRNILLVSAENPRGATVFRDLVADPPTTEQEFILLWKIYLAVLVAHKMRDLGIDTKGINTVYSILEEAQLLEPEINLAGLLRTAQNIARRLLKATRIEAGVELHEVSGAPAGIIGRITLAEPSGELRRQGMSSIDGLYQTIDNALASVGYQIWVLLDRLDVAFAERHELEANALRALIRVYGDLGGFNNISLKIFLREDIWNRITAAGLREASHITRFESVSWNDQTLLNLLMRRILSNDVLLQELSINKAEILDDLSKQEELFSQLFPEKVEQGTRKPSTFRWMITRCTDATGNTAPRELIHLLICLRAEEIKRLEVGGIPASGKQLFDRSVFKAALPEVSQMRLSTYLYAEYPDEKQYVEKLKGHKAEQTIDSLMQLWELDKNAAIKVAERLVSLGFFQQRTIQQKGTFWVPFLYRDALGLLMGKSEGEASDAEG